MKNQLPANSAAIQPEGKGVKILLAEDDDFFRGKGLDLGAKNFIINAHFTVEEIIEKIRDIIERKNIKAV